MPYIKSEDRKLFDELIVHLAVLVSTPGDLNYIITTLLHWRLKDRGLNYANLNEAIGVLECAKQELYRRVVVPYEDGKILANGDLEVLL